VEARTLDLLEALGRALMWTAIAVVILSVVAAISIATSESAIPGIDELQRENRGVISVLALGGGLVGGGMLAGLGAIIRLLVADRRAR
jgi:hypothetical protein